MKITQDYAFSNWDGTTTIYIGYENKDGGWIIQKIVVASGEVTYARGEYSYSTNWTARAGLTYVAYSGAF